MRRATAFRIPMIVFLVLPLFIASHSIAEERPTTESASHRAEVIRKRAEWFHNQRAYPRKKIPRAARLKALKELDAMRARDLRARSSSATGSSTPDVLSLTSWTPVGPQPISVAPNLIGGGTPVASGRVTALAVDPTNASVVYLGAAQGGVWKSVDGGATWTSLTDTQASLAVGSLALDPSNPSIIYVGTGEENFSGDSYFGAGILKSSDGGATWANIPGPFAGPVAADAYYGGGARIGALAVHPTNGNIILAGALGGSGDGIYRSSDGGATWANVLLSGPGTAVLFDPTNGNTAYAAVDGIGVFISSDAGRTWTPRNGTAPNTLSTFNIGRIELTLDPSHPATLYAGVSLATSQNLLALYKTTDGGAHWAGLPGPPQYCNSQCDYDNVVRVDPANSNVIYAGGAAGSDNAHTLWRSLDGGNTWAEISQGANGVNLHVDHHALAFAADGSLLYVGNDGGVWSTPNVTTSPVNWTNLNASLAVTQFYPGISVDPVTDARTFGGTQDNGTVEYSGNPQWTELDPCGDGGYTAIDPAAPGTVYAACTQGEGVFKSTSGGAGGTWSLIANGLNTAERSNFIQPMVLDPINPQTIYFGTYRVYQSTNGGNNWEVISPDLTLGGAASSVNAIAVAPGNSNIVYAGTSDGQVQVTTNASQGVGASWNHMSLGLPPRYITQIAADPVDPMTAYVAFSGFSGFGDTQGHVFQTVNGGAAWADISGNLPNIPVNDIVVDPNLPTTLYAATDIGVFATHNSGATWTTLMTGLPRVAVLSLNLHAPSRTLRAASHGRSAWDLPVPISNGLSISPAQVSFVTQPIGTTSAAQTVTLSNLSGSTTLNITSITSSGDFSATDGCGNSLAANASCAIPVSFMPTAQGARFGILTFVDSDSTGTQSVILIGMGLGGTTVTLAPTSLMFPNQIVAVTSPPQSITLTNTGGAPLNISSITTSGTFGSTFAQSNNCGASVSVGASCSIQVTFTPPPGVNPPLPAGAYTGTLLITDNATGSPQTVALAGTSADFTINLAANSAGSATVTAGQTATYNLALSDITGFSGTVALSCSGAPTLATCIVSPAKVILNGAIAAAPTVTVTTTSRSIVFPGPAFRPPATLRLRLWPMIFFLAAGWMVVMLGRRNMHQGPQHVHYGLRWARAVLLFALLGTLSLAACGGGGSPSGSGHPGTPAGTYTLDVAATYTQGTAKLSRDIKLTLTVR